ncbi:hypothetical protein ACMSFF_28880 [Bacteroides faecis]
MKTKLLAFLPFMATFAMGQQTYFVSHGGNDSADGSLNSPLLHIHEALERGKASAEREIHIYIREGKYYLDTPLVVDAGEWKNKRLTLSAYNNEPVVLSGARKLSLKWVKQKNGIWKARQKPIRVTSCLWAEKKGFLPVTPTLKKALSSMERLPMRLHQPV